MGPPKNGSDDGSNGLWISPTARGFFKQKKIGAKELLLLTLIYNLTKEKDSKNPIGCYASNAWLADEIVIEEPKNVGRMITKLEKLGLVKKTFGKGGKRYLLPTWFDG